MSDAVVIDQIDIGCLSPVAAASAMGPQMFDARACKRWMFIALRGSSPCCPACGVELDDAKTNRLMDGKSIRCQHCDTISSSRSGTILEGSTLTDQQFFFILVMLQWDFPPAQIAIMAGCSRAAVYSWRQRLGIA